MTARQRRWHDTTGHKWALIAQEGGIKPATAFIPWREKPAVWFPTHPLWEPTACKRLYQPDGTLRRLTREETAAYGGGLARIGVAAETAPHDWPAYRRRSGVAPGVASCLAKAAKAQGADPRQWSVRLEAVPAALWVAVEVW